MHSRNPYRDPPDFSVLAAAYPLLQPHIISTSNGPTIDFKNEASQRCLTEALLYRDFGIKLSLPSNRLCPPVPNRLNYVLWIQDVVQVTSDPVRPVKGIDIGTGASAIYPLLACALQPTWTFVGTDVDDISLSYARQNVAANNLEERIELVLSTASNPILLPLSLDTQSEFCFTMCNPPFYSSVEDITRSAEQKAFSPVAVCTGADIEMITPGGESAFVCQMVEESVNFGSRCQWYTSMLGKMSSLTEVVATLRQRSIDNYAITEFIQGHTRRWAIAWSFGDLRLPDSISRILNPTLHALIPPRNTLQQHVPNFTLPKLFQALQTVIASISGVTYRSGSHDISTEATPPLIVAAAGNTWSRNARRKKAVLEPANTEFPPSLICRVTCTAEDTQIYLVFQWIRGRDRSLFESFCSHVSRKVREL